MISARGLSDLSRTRFSPIETAIIIMEQPPKQYKIHKSIAEIERSDIERLIKI